MLQGHLARYKASVLKAACEGRLVPQDENDEPAPELLARILAERRAQWETANPGKKYKEPAGVDTAGLPVLPEGWVWVTMDQISEQRLGKMLDKSKNTGELRPYLRNTNVRWFGFDLSDIQELRASDSELDNISVKYGDLVVCEGGEPGRSAVWENYESFVIQKALHRVRTANGVSPWYLNFRLTSDANTGRLEKYFTGSTIKHFTGQSLRFYLISLPPTEEQKRIVAEVERRLSVVAATEQAITANLARADRLRQSILHRAFTGQLV
jgi:type I restriction enzyme S subunit